MILPLDERIERGGDAGAVRFATSLFEARLLARAAGWEVIDGPPVTLACAPREERTLRLIALGLGLAARGCRVEYLGAVTPTASLRERPAATTIVSVDHDDLAPDEREDLRALDALLTGSAGPRLADALRLTALPHDVHLAAAHAAEAARQRSSWLGDDRSPGRP